MYVITINRFSPLKPPANVLAGVGPIEKRYSQFLKKIYNTAKMTLLGTETLEKDMEQAMLDSVKEKVNGVQLGEMSKGKAIQILQIISGVYTADKNGAKLELNNEFKELKGVRIPYIRCINELIREDEYTLSLISSYFENKLNKQNVQPV